MNEGPNLDKKIKPVEQVPSKLQQKLAEMPVVRFARKIIPSIQAEVAYILQGLSDPDDPE